MAGYNISFVFPMFNEEDNIAAAIERATALAGEICDDYEIIIADDASTDKSAAIVEAISKKDPRVKLIRLRKNSRFGGALKAGLLAATKEIVLYTDADFPAKEEDIKRALSSLDGADIVTAYSLVIKDSSLKRIIMSKTYNFLVHRLFGLKIHDINSGLKIYRKKVFDGMELRSMSPFIDVEIFSEAAKKLCRVKQHGLVFELRTGGISTISRPGIVARTFLDMLAYRLRR